MLHATKLTSESFFVIHQHKNVSAILITHLSKYYLFKI